MVRVYRYRLYPTKAQDELLCTLLEHLRELYNAALQERCDAYKRTGKSPNYYDQVRDLREIRALRYEFAAIHTHLLQDTLTRLDRAYKAFFRRCKSGETPGYPRFKGFGRYKTFTFADASNNNGVKLVSGNKRLRIHGIGNVKIKIHRPCEGRLKQVSVTLNSDGHWYAAFICDSVTKKLLVPSGGEIGIDLGLATFAAFSDGTMIANPRILKTAQRSVTKAQRKVSKRKNGSVRRRKAVRLLAKQHAHACDARKDFHHKTARALVRAYDSISVEDLNVNGLARSVLAGPIHDAGWTQFLSILASKAEEAGCELLKVNPRGTSQMCSACGEEVRKNLSVRIHDCPHCGIVLDRDVNAARNILRLGQSLRRGALNRDSDDPRIHSSVDGSGDGVVT